MLVCVIRGSIYTAHHEIDREDIGRADQCDNQAVEAAVFAKRGCQGPGGRPRRVETAGLSLCPGGEGNAANYAGAGRKSGVHCKTSEESGVESEAARKEFGRNDQHYSHRSIGEGSSKRALKWLSLSGQVAWSWSIALIDCPARRWPRFTGFWCRKRRSANQIITYR